MHYSVLGPLAVWTSAGEPVSLTGVQPRTLLAVLLFHANRAVSLDELVDALWGENPPKSYLSNLHTYVSRLRRQLTDTPLVHLDHSYRLEVDPRRLDTLVFASEVAAGREAARLGQLELAVRHFRQALAEWRGRPLAGLVIPALEPEILRLQSERVLVLEECLDAELRMGRHAEVISELRRLVVEHPLRERLRALLMTALWRSGDQAVALEVYREGRMVLVDELGTEPGPELQRLHAEILAGEGESAEPGPKAAPVRQLPLDVTDLTGREAEADAIRAHLREAGDVVPVVVLSGNPGAGKSALAVHVAHSVSEVYRDGQLFVPLEGASGRGVGPGQLLGHLLTSLGVPASAVPEGVEARAAAFRAALAGRSVLVVLDDAADAGQVRPFLPGTPGSAVIVTSRSRLSGLARTLTEPVRPLADSAADDLLRRVIGEERVDEEPEGAARIVAACGGLPLALRVAACRLAARPHLPLAHLAERLEDAHRRLDELTTSDLQVRASLATSYHGLSALARRALRSLGTLRAREVAAWTVAVLLDVADPDSVLEELVEANLLEPSGRDEVGEPRYRIHDLLLVFAEERAVEEDVGADRLAGLLRLVERAIDLTELANRGLPTTFGPFEPRAGADTVRSLPRVARQLEHDPLLWLTAERRLLVHLIRLARATGWHRRAVVLTDRLVRFFLLCGGNDEIRELVPASLDDLSLLGDERLRARAEFAMTWIDILDGDVEQAARTQRRCAATLLGLGERRDAAFVLNDYAGTLIRLGRLEEALGLAGEAVRIFDGLTEFGGQACSMQNCAVALRLLGRVEEALETSERALVLARKSRENRWLMIVLNTLVWMYLQAGRPREARAGVTEAMELLGSSADRSELRSNLLHVRAYIEAAAGNHALAERQFEESHAYAELMRSPLMIAQTQRDLAAVWLGTGRHGEALAVLRSTAATFSRFGLASEEVLSLRLLALAHTRLGDRAAAAAATRDADRLGPQAEDSARVRMRILFDLAAGG
ncbi:tetratricopeptide repeat protein [Allokutzneria sp. A3M-2-11 16]|uniref:AfsR/SARP family transcriptional regulator n=1 Tax=Allokutzneria sp. A3M-2-11 16 TaxID=2962043 RepID=UPI0020B6A1F9|nr:BTAD domain-containing putative transcriptional regulator [Allokutzneria sp. A3M-2-11 16]MCP3804821.1 tetratricopeptide repeat protein [Allokutzneria sp. A3M-2-11 16]